MMFRAKNKYLLVNPYSGVNQEIPNMALAYLSAYLHAGVVDLNTKKRPKNRYLDFSSDILALSVQTRNYSNAIDIAGAYKHKYPKAEIKSISGFIDVQCCYPFVDFNEKIEIPIDFSDQLPFPDYELFDSFAIFKKCWQSGKWQYPLMTSLGCPFQCVYCASRNRRVKFRSVGNCREELLQAKKRWGIRSFVVIDDCFNFSKKRVLEFCADIASLGLPWICANGLRADIFDSEIAKALKKAGCWQISFGVESSDPSVLENIKKGETIGQIERSILIAKNFFSTVNCYFIIGLPGSSYESDLASLNWARKHKVNAFFSYYVPLDKAKDNIFYGSSAKPLSSSYPLELQEKIYRMTYCMRPFSLRDPISTWGKRFIRWIARKNLK